MHKLRILGKGRTGRRKHAIEVAPNLELESCDFGMAALGFEGLLERIQVFNLLARKKEFLL